MHLVKTCQVYGAYQRGAHREIHERRVYYWECARVVNLHSNCITYLKIRGR